jgi:hypothetical protein
VVVLGLLNVVILTADLLKLAQEAFFKGNDEKIFSTHLPLAKKRKSVCSRDYWFYFLQRDGCTDIISFGAESLQPPIFEKSF